MSDGRRNSPTIEHHYNTRLAQAARLVDASGPVQSLVPPPSGGGGQMPTLPVGSSTAQEVFLEGVGSIMEAIDPLPLEEVLPSEIA